MLHGISTLLKFCVLCCIWQPPSLRVHIFRYLCQARHTTNGQSLYYKVEVRIIIYKCLLCWLFIWENCHLNHGHYWGTIYTCTHSIICSRIWQEIHWYVLERLHKGLFIFCTNSYIPYIYFFTSPSRKAVSPVSVITRIFNVGKELFWYT